MNNICNFHMGKCIEMCSKLNTDVRNKNIQCCTPTEHRKSPKPTPRRLQLIRSVCFYDTKLICEYLQSSASTCCVALLCKHLNDWKSGHCNYTAHCIAMVEWNIYDRSFNCLTKENGWSSISVDHNLGVYLDIGTKSFYPFNRLLNVRQWGHLTLLFLGRENWSLTSESWDNG